MNRFFNLAKFSIHVRKKNWLKIERKMVLQCIHGTIAPSINAHRQHYQPRYIGFVLASFVSAIPGF